MGRARRLGFSLVYTALGLLLVAAVARAYDSTTGFTSLLLFGDHYAVRRIERLRDVPIHIYPLSSGYDGQFYAQMAVEADPFDPDLYEALDVPAYRLRRVLLPLTAHVLGLGRPSWVLNVYALSNLVGWIALAWMLARWWFPPGRLDDLVRWAGILFGAGMLVSVTRGLTDGPSLVLLAAGVRCVERGRSWWGAALIGLAGLARETSLLAAAAFLPGDRPAPAARGTEPGGRRRALGHALLFGSACVLPGVAWTLVLFGRYGEISTGALGMPVTAFLRACGRIGEIQAAGLTRFACEHFAVAASTLVQVVFLLLWRPWVRWNEAWGRVGSAFAVLALFLGWGFWEDPVNGVPRALLPLALAFNVVVPRAEGVRGLGWLALLVAGNLTVVSAPTTLAEVRPRPRTIASDVGIQYVSGWYPAEHGEGQTWRWSSGRAELALHNPAAKPARVRLEFELFSDGPRSVVVKTGDIRLVFELEPQRRLPCALGPFVLAPGDTRIAFESDEPPLQEPRGRALSFTLRSETVVLAE